MLHTVLPDIGTQRGLAGNGGDRRAPAQVSSAAIRIRRLPNRVPLSAARSLHQGDDCCLDGFDVRITII
jgi:hypothetical protein